MPTKLLRIWPAVALLIVAGCSSSHGSKVTATTSTTAAATSTTAATVPSPSTTGASATTSTTASAGGPLPTGFTVADLTWVSDNQGWALGAAPCAHAPCTSVVHTLDGGRTWAGLPAPTAYLQDDFAASSSAPACSATVACVQGIRFADANTGYAFGVSSLWLTTNGGHTWSLRSTDPTDALEIAHGTVVRITHPGGIGCPPGCPYQVQSTTVGSTTWHSLSSPNITGVGAVLAVEGTNVYEAAFGHRAGGAGDAHTAFARSTDGGAHWSTFSDPCTVTPSGDEADATAISAASGGFLAVGCTARVTGQAGFAVVSANAGATFGPHRGGLLSTVPPDGEFVDKIAAATGQRLAILVSSSAGLDIVVTNDAGSDWTVTHTQLAVGFNPAIDVYLGFQDATTGRAVVVAGTILTTTDGGGHWTPFTFP